MSSRVVHSLVDSHLHIVNLDRFRHYWMKPELGILQRRTGRFDAARDSYQRVLAIHPGFHYALLNLGVLCDIFLEDLSCALDSYSKYAEIVVDDPQVGVWIADVQNRLGQADVE